MSVFKKYFTDWIHKRNDAHQSDRDKLRILNFHIVMLGDSEVGKNSFIVQFIHNSFPTCYNPVIEDVYSKSIVVDGRSVNLTITNTASQEEYHQLLTNPIEHSDGFLVFYSITDVQSLQTARSYLDLIARAKHTNDFPVVIVANKSDLEKERRVPTEQGVHLAEEYHAGFFESSAQSYINVVEPFVSLVSKMYHYHSL